MPIAFCWSFQTAVNNKTENQRYLAQKRNRYNIALQNRKTKNLNGIVSAERRNCFLSSLSKKTTDSFEFALSPYVDWPMCRVRVVCAKVTDLLAAQTVTLHYYMLLWYQFSELYLSQLYPFIDWQLNAAKWYRPWTNRARHRTSAECEPVLLIMESSKSTEMIIVDGPGTTFTRKYSKERIITYGVLVVALVFLIVGIVLITIAANDKKNEKSGSTSKQEQEEKTTEPNSSTTIGAPTSAPTSTPTSTPPPTATTSPLSRCNFSEEAKRVGLGEFLDRVKETYFKLHPHDVHWDPDVTVDRVKTDYAGYDPTPSMIKNRTDSALGLLSEISGKKINTNSLKPRERKALAQVKHYLKHVFGQPYDVNYYAGDWMMGPNLFCWQEICYIGHAVHNGLGLYHKPCNASDVQLIEKKLQTHKAGILRYIENMKMGVRKGMIRSVEECEAGINTIKRQYLNISLYNSTGTGMYIIYFVIVVFALCKQSALISATVVCR